MLTVILLTSALGYRFYNAPKLDAKKAAPQTIYAPASVTIEDQLATEAKRKQVLKEATPVLMLDQDANSQIRQTLEQQIAQGNELRQLAGNFPFVKGTMLSLQTQTLLRQAEENDWQRILTAVNAVADSGGRSPTLSQAQQQAVIELQRYRQTVEYEAHFSLIQEITKARFNYQLALNALPQTTPDLKPIFDADFLNLADADWQQIQLKIPQISDRILTQGIPPGLPEDLLQAAVEIQTRDALPEKLAPIATQILLQSLKPNLMRDDDQTRLSAEKAAQEIKPEVVSVRRGDAIVRAGETISSSDFALLDYFGLSRRGIDWWGLFGFGTWVSAAVMFYWWVERQQTVTLRQRDRLLIVLLILSTPLLVALQVPATNLPAIGLLTSTFYGSPLAVVVTALVTVLLPLGGVPVSWSELLASGAAGLLCAVLAGRLRSREELALLGIAVGVLQGLLYLLLNAASGIIWYTLLGSTAVRALLGLAWCVMAIGISPYLEQTFDLVTTLRLVELANPNRPLLKRLAAEAPGTFQHTLFVATLAEAAARSLNCNVELVRTGTLYHDIGKMHDPKSFIENQMGGANKHDAIADPWKSATIIKQHVSEGLVMARKFRLPKAVQAFIPEHQGTMLIAYFYHQAQQKMPSTGNSSTCDLSPVLETDFRYDGPVPQSRETGIVMLADSCEAALRSLKDATPQDALAMVNKIIRARWQDNQLIDSQLTREELTHIATIFIEVWQQFNHQRIAYPKIAFNPQPAVAK
jgi:putative nucleotidyltransferase with HDIG domain